MAKKIILFGCVLIYHSFTFSQTLTLDYYLEKGLQNSPLIKDYQNQISSATFDSLMVAAAQKPQVTGNAGLYYAPAFNNGVNGYDEVLTNGGQYTASVGLAQTILNRKVISNKYHDIQIQKRSLSNTQKLSGNDLRRVITNQYLTIYSDYSNLVFNQEFLKLMNDEKNIMKNLVDHAIYKQTDYLSLLIETQSQEILVNQQQAQLNNDIQTINQICGINDTGQHQFALPVISQKDQADLSQSPLFMQYKLDSLKILNQKTTVDLRYQPKVSWNADAGFLSSKISNVYQHYGFSVGLNLNIPIYDGHQRKLDYQKLAVSENTRLNYESFFKIQYTQQILQLNNALNSNKVVIEQLTNQLKSARELIAMAKAQLNIGNMPVTEFINAAKNYITINSNLTQFQIKELQYINEINYLMQ